MGGAAEVIIGGLNGGIAGGGGGGCGEAITYSGAVPQVVAGQMRAYFNAKLRVHEVCAYCARRSKPDVHGNCPGCGAPK